MGALEGVCPSVSPAPSFPTDPRPCGHGSRTVVSAGRPQQALWAWSGLPGVPGSLVANLLSSFQVVSSQPRWGRGGAAAPVQGPARELPGKTQQEPPGRLHAVRQVGGWCCQVRTGPEAPQDFKGSEHPQAPQSFQRGWAVRTPAGGEILGGSLAFLARWPLGRRGPLGEAFREGSVRWASAGPPSHPLRGLKGRDRAPISWGCRPLGVSPET